MRAHITGEATVLGIVGRPVAHSLSPVIHNAWIEAAGLDAIYVPFAATDEAAFETLVSAGRAGMIRALNVTAPFKELAFASADAASDAARLTRSANILLFRRGRIRADSSDGVGLLSALQTQAPALVLEGANVALLGAGGAARAGAGALVQAGAEVRIVNRTRERAEALAADLGPGVEAAGDEALDNADLVINALSVQPGFDLARLQADAVVMDMTYRPVVTPFLQAARARGLVCVDGLAMLIGQAAPLFEAAFGQAPPSLDLRELLIRHLEAVA